jgi:hypothetical protein
MAELPVSLALKASLQCFFTSLQGNKPFTSDGLRSQDREQLIKAVPRRRGSHPSGGCVLDSSKVRIYCMEPTWINAVIKMANCTILFSVLKKATSHGCTNSPNEHCEYSSMCCETSSGTCTCPIRWSARPIKGVCSRCFDHHDHRQSSPSRPTAAPERTRHISRWSQRES